MCYKHLVKYTWFDSFLRPIILIKIGKTSVMKPAQFYNVGTLTLTDWAYLCGKRVGLHKYIRQLIFFW
jgi:hypothetical protein